jgi:hypothetical protein
MECAKVKVLDALLHPVHHYLAMWKAGGIIVSSEEHASSDSIGIRFPNPRMGTGI